MSDNSRDWNFEPNLYSVVFFSLPVIWTSEVLKILSKIYAWERIFWSITIKSSSYLSLSLNRGAGM
jgi:hypothetical protein